MGFVTSQMIREAFFNNECQNFIVYGPLGYGKTAYGLLILMEIYKTEDVDMLKKYFFFDPAEFLRKVTKFKQQVPTVAWDDAGVWLYYMDFQSGLLKSVAKMMQLIRTRTASVIYTTPSPTLIVGKLRNFPQTITLKISKISGNQYEKRLRRATAYRSWMMPDLQKMRVKKLYYDDFNCIIPNDVYDWYINERKGYIEQIEEQLQKSLPPALMEQVAEDKRIEEAASQPARQVAGR